MELWIRSQDKTMLYKANEVFTESVINNCKETGEYYICVNNEGFATYKSKERALEVLDEIQQFVNNDGCTFISQDVQSISLNAYKVYEMPSE